jgi:phospholipid/cholesterol/gamma-HCH transport system substrate-binding protein
VKTQIRKHMKDFLAILALFVLALGISAYLLSNQRLRFPLVQEKPFVVKAVLENAQAVQPGQGQTVRVAGVEVGQIGKIELEEGKAVVDMQLEGKYKGLIRDDATALLRTRTGLKDMFLEVDPGEGKPLAEKARIQVGNTAPDIDPDEILAALDTDTRDYLKLLISGGGKGLKGRGNDLREVFRRLGPLHRDLAKVTTAVARRRANLRSLVHNYGLLTSELGKNDKDITRLVRSSNSVFEALGSEEQNISAAVARLPGSLRQTKETLAKVDTLGQRLRPALSSLRPAFRQLDETNAEVLPFVKEATPILRNQTRPFTRVGQPFFSNLGSAARDLNRGEPDLTKTFGQLNRLFNIGAFNTNGREGLSGNLVQDRARDEGYLYQLAWLAQNTNSLFSTGDAQGPSRRIFLQGLDCGILASQAEDDLSGLPPSVSTPIVDTVDEAFNELGNAGVCNSGGEGP